jgi:hypothetical protein
VNPHEHSCSWYPYTELLGSTGANYCEATKCQWISQPINSYSGLSFLIVGLLLIFSLIRRDNKILQDSIVFICAIGISYYLYHMSLTYFFFALSQLFIYIFLNYNLANRLLSLDKVHEKNFYPIMLGIPLVLVGLDYILHLFFITTNWLTPIIVFSYMLIFYNLEKEVLKYPLFITAGFTLASYFTQLVEQTRFFCDPFNKYFQVQALSNVLLALGIASFYFYIFQFFDIRKINFNIQFGTAESDEATGEIDLAEFQEMKRLAKQLELEKSSSKNDFFLDVAREPEEEIDDSQLQMNFDDSDENKEDK